MTWWFVLAEASRAASPTFALDDLEVTLVLPEGAWRMRRWSGAELDVVVGPVQVVAWGTRVQVPITEVASWTPVFEQHLTPLPRLDRMHLAVVANRRVAFSDLTIPLDGVRQRVVRGATIEIPGGNLHLAAMSPPKAAGQSAEVLRGILEGLVVPTVPAAAFGATLTTLGARVPLPSDWRPAFEAEADLVPAAVGCASAIAPEAGAAPRWLTVCHLDRFLGVVDRYSAPVIEPEIRAQLFGPDAPVGEAVPLPDRTGLRFRPTEDRVVGLVPHAEGVTQFALEGSSDARVIEAMMQASAYTGPHPTSLRDQLWYWLWVRTTSPLVLGGFALALFLGVGLVGVAVRAWTRRPPETDP